MSKSERATKYFFWAAFGAFLAMSVPHVAWVFRQYEPNQPDLAWWAVSWGVAISIDLLICWLSYTRSDQEQKKADGAITWIFIFLLALLSWYCNWLFSEVMSGIDAWSFSLPFGLTTFGSLTPIIVSAIPMFMIAYTYMSRRILSKKSEPKSAQELQQDLAELRQKSVLELQIAALKNKQKSSWIRGKFQMISDAFSDKNDAEIAADLTQSIDEIKQDFDQNQPEIEDEITVISGSDVRQNRAESLPKLTVVEQTMFDAFMQHPEDANELLRISQEKNLDEFVTILRHKYPRYANYITVESVAMVLQHIWRKSPPILRKISADNIPIKPSQYLMTFEEASAYTGYAISTLKKQLATGEILANKSGDKLKVSTLKIRTGNTGKMPAITVEKVPATNGR